MTGARLRKLKSGFARKAGRGGVGALDAVAAAEVRLGDMREHAMQGVAAILGQAEGARPGVAAGDEAAFDDIHRAADALVGLCGLFEVVEVGQAAFSLCQLLDAAAPGRPSAQAVCVHLDAMQLFWTATPELRASCARGMLEGLRQVAAVPNRRTVAT